MPLDPELAEHLERDKRMPARASLSVDQTRERMVAAQSLAEATDPLVREEDLRAGGVRARQYWPTFDRSLPLIVFAHGGRFFSGCIESHQPMCRNLAVLSGCRVLAVDYRLAPEHPWPAAVDDTVAAVDWALGEAERVAVCGDSAGGCLAALAALERPALSCQVLLYPMLDPECSTESHREFATGYGPGSDDMKRGWQLYTSRTDKESRLSPLYAADLSGAPPAYVITCEYDTLRDEGEAYAERLRSAGTDVRLERVPGAVHGFAMWTRISGLARTTLVAMGAWLAAELRP